MPKLSYPEDMSDLIGETMSPDPIRDNIEAISDLVNLEGLDWQNVVQWSLDHRHVYPAARPPGDPENTKVANSAWSGGFFDPGVIPSLWSGIPTVWSLVAPPGEQRVNVRSGAGVFIYASLIVGIGVAARTTDVQARQELRIQTKLSGAGGWDWATLWDGAIGNNASVGGTPAIIGAVKATVHGVLSVRMEYRGRTDISNAPGEAPTSWGYGNLSIFVVNQ